MNNSRSILDKWGITEKELTELVEENPSLRGILLGYIAERKFRDKVLTNPYLTDQGKDNDHDRTRKGDRRLLYRDKQFLIEVKSLQSNLVKKIGQDSWIGKAQVDASDSRKVKFPDGSILQTTCLLRNEFDLLAINCFAFGDQWRFAFALNMELPENTYKKYTEYQRKLLLPTLITVKWPLELPFYENPIEPLEKLFLLRS